MVTDHEAAWIALGEYITSRPQHGQHDLLRKMAELQAEHRVPAGELSRLLRLHGVEVERASRSMAADIDRDGLSDSDADALRGGSDGRTGHHRAEGVHDGSRDGAEAAVRV